jgi:RHS repeat-associated protein
MLSPEPTVYTYNSMNELTVVTDPLGLATSFGYDAAGNQTSVADAMGRITTTIYDALNRPTVVIDPMGNRVTTTYDAEGEALTFTDALNRTTTYTYSVRGWVATETDPMGYLTTFTYTPTGKDSATYQTTLFPIEESFLTYDADDRLIGQANGLSEITTYGYDGVGNVTSVEDPNDNITTYVYNSRNELIEEIEPLSVTVSYTYDASGNQQTVTDALGHTTTTLYDALNRAATMISAVSGTTTITYDAAGRETSLTDPVGNKTQWAYDADDRMTTQTDPNGHTVTYVYDNDGELTDTTDEDGRRTTYSYNADGDQTGETWVGASPSEKITYTYDADNEMTGAADSFATLTFTYNNDGWLLTDATSGPGSGQPTVTLTYSYNQLGEETSVTDSLSSQGITTYTYSAAQQLTEITTSYGGTSGPQVSYTYDNASRLTSVWRQVGTGTNASHVNTTVVYDNANRIVTITDGASNYIPLDFGWVNTPLATYVYSYDDADRVTSETDAEGIYTYAYDSANELTTVTENSTVVGSYSYDLNGNRTGSGYSTTVMNETATSPGTTYTYDNSGNMLTSKTGSTTTTYTYDYRNRLTEVTTGGTVVATYTYNALSQRIGIEDGGTQTWTAYDGTSADANPYADFNGSGSLTERYLFGPGVVNGAAMSVILARTSFGGTTAWYLTDKLGTVRDIVDTSGNELDHVVYDSFGNILTETNATNGDRFKFAGMQFDATIGMYYDHARYYSSTLGRFTASDPLGFSGQDSNLSRYVFNNPQNLIDPLGLFAPPPLGIGKWDSEWFWKNVISPNGPTSLPPDYYEWYRGGCVGLLKNRYEIPESPELQMNAVLFKDWNSLVKYMLALNPNPDLLPKTLQIFAIQTNALLNLNSMVSNQQYGMLNGGLALKSAIRGNNSWNYATLQRNMLALVGTPSYYWEFMNRGYIAKMPNPTVVHSLKLPKFSTTIFGLIVVERPSGIVGNPTAMPIRPPMVTDIPTQP